MADTTNKETTSNRPKVDIECKPQRNLHVIDRRDFLKDEQGKYVLDPKTGQKQMNARCVCGLTTSHASDYRGGEQIHIYSDDDAKKNQVQVA